MLWQAALRNTVTIESVNGAPALIDILPLLISLLAVNLDLLGKIIGLVESYLLLGAPLVLQVIVRSPCYFLCALTSFAEFRRTAAPSHFVRYHWLSNIN